MCKDGDSDGTFGHKSGNVRGLPGKQVHTYVSYSF